MSESRTPGSFGCGRCWPDSPEEARAASRDLRHEADLIDESHFHVAIRACASCSQRFVSVFTEIIDWIKGEDPQCWTLLPITDAERADLEAGGPVTEAKLGALAPGRRSLRHEWPRDDAPRSYWATGISVGPHD
jgi:hypothetical protein